MVEYGLILALIAVVVIVGLTALGGNIRSLFENIAGQIASP
ncbi:MAG: Flp family type IVb pilin [Clostridia bacterium]|nr:Flp family type IVb pilin [Clostridia bacterium]